MVPIYSSVAVVSLTHGADTLYETEEQFQSVVCRGFLTEQRIVTQRLPHLYNFNAFVLTRCTSSTSHQMAMHLNITFTPRFEYTLRKRKLQYPNPNFDTTNRITTFSRIFTKLKIWFSPPRNHSIYIINISHLMNKNATNVQCFQKSHVPISQFLLKDNQKRENQKSFPNCSLSQKVHSCFSPRQHGNPQWS